MKSRTSFFNLTALRKDITRFAPVWALYLIGGLLVGLSTISGYDVEHGYGARDLASTIGPLTVVNLIYAIVTAELLFGDLFNNRLCNALHAFPMRRESWFATHIVAGLLFSFVPNLILSICFLPLMDEMWYISFIWLLGVTIEYLFFFGLAAFSAMCTGNRFAMAAVYTLINFLSMVVYWFVQTFYEPLLYGLHIRETGFLRFCPTAWVTELELVEFQFVPVNGNYSGWNGEYYVYYDTMMEYVYDGLTDAWWYMGILAVLGIALLGTALLLYRRRKLESAGDFAAFRWLKPIFCVVFTLSVGALFEMFGQSMFGDEYIFLAVGIVVGFFVSQMLLQRTLRVFRVKTIAACAAIGGALILSIVLTAIDPLGITRWTPNPDKVMSVAVSDNYYYEPDFARKPMIVTTPELIEDLVEAHRLILAEGEAGNGSLTKSVHLTYKLSDGRQVTRRYFYRTQGKAAQALNEFFTRPDFILGYEDWSVYLTQVKSVTTDYTTFSGTQAVELLTAIRADCEAGNMLQSRSWTMVDSHIRIETKDGKTISIAVYQDCRNTLNWLSSHQ